MNIVIKRSHLIYFPLFFTLLASCSDESIPVTDLFLNEEEIDLVVWDTFQLIPTLTPESAKQQTLSWVSDDESIITVDGSGLITAVFPGIANVTVSTGDGRFTAECRITVNARIPTEEVFLDRSSLELSRGFSELLSTSISPADATDTRVRWSSSDETIAAVSSDGTVTALALGTAVITVTTEDGGFFAECTVTVIYSEFISLWKTDNYGESADNQISLPLSPDGTYNFNISWGDGTMDLITDWDDPAKIHKYDTPGTFVLTITGRIESWRFDCSGDDEKIIELRNWGSLKLDQSSHQFAGCKNLIITAENKPGLESTESFVRMFRDCDGITSIPGFQEWDTSRINDFGWMFENADNFNQDISFWDTSGVRNMDYMFREATSFNQDLSNWNTIKVTNMSGMFYEASYFNGDISGWNTSNVISMDNMFRMATTFNQPLSSWNTSNVEDMSHMFAGAITFNQDISSWDTGRATNMRYLFNSATSFSSNLSTWNTSRVTDMSAMFAYTETFNGNIRSWNTSQVTDMSSMFREAAVFNQNISSWDTSKVTTMKSMFAYAHSFDQDLSGWDITSVIEMSNMFLGVRLSTANYDALLIDWELQDVQDNVAFSAGTSRYTSEDAAAARQRLIDEHNWIITDGGEVP